MSDVVGQRNTRWINHRATAHTMHRRGQSLDVIADHLRVHKRSVHRYLALPCPEPVPDESGVDLADFYMKGACGSFPELDWLSRNRRVQEEVKAVCAHCPVLAICRAYGLTAGSDESGIWGGLTKAERHHEIRRQAPRRAARRGEIVAQHQQQGAA